jgi:hypothetical protein
MGDDVSYFPPLAVVFLSSVHWLVGRCRLQEIIVFEKISSEIQHKVEQNGPPLYWICYKSTCRAMRCIDVGSWAKSTEIEIIVGLCLAHKYPVSLQKYSPKDITHHNGYLFVFKSQSHFRSTENYKVSLSV